MTNDKFIRGDIRVLYVKIAGVFLPVACLTENSFNESAQALETTTLDNDGWTSSIPTNQSYSITFSGLQIYTLFQPVGDATKASYDRLKALKRGRAIFEWEIRTNDNVFIDYGKGWISELTESAPVGEYMTFTGTIVGVGVPEFTSDLVGSVTWDSTTVTFDNTIITWDNAAI